MKYNHKIISAPDSHYYVDIDNTRLVNTMDRNNVLRIQEMSETEEGYEFIYDIKGKFITHDLMMSRHPLRETAKVQIPFLTIIDPEAMAAKYGIDVSHLPQKDSELKCNLNMLEQRVAGKLPIIKIHDHDFIVDLRLGLLRPKDDFRTMGIVLDELPMDAACTVYSCLYHTKRHEVFLWDEHITSIPRDVIPIEIPNPSVLDPLGYAMRFSDMNGLTARYPIGNMETIKAIDWQATGMENFFNQYPLRDNLCAQVIDWNHTSIPEIINKNIAERGRKRMESGKGQSKKRRN